MARDRANINTNIWTDDDWRDLSRDEHWLYTALLTSPSLSYAGVADWRPNRIAQNSSNTTASDVELIGKLLESKRFIFIDETTEEVLVRSFLRHDGLLKQPKLGVSMVNAYGAISSKLIRKVVIHELRRIHDEHPEWRAFEVGQVKELLKLSGSDMSAFTPGFTPAVTPNPEQALALPTTTATTTATEASLPVEEEEKKPATKLPKSWAPTASHMEAAKAKNLDLVDEAENFRLHAETHDRRCASWNGAFATWLKRATPKQPQSASPWSQEYHS
jgi:hypothetical protein